MDYDKLYSYTQSKLFTDVSLTLTDMNHSITFFVHRNILSASCLYFEKLFTVLKEKDSNNITIEVPNVYVTYDIIISFYSQKTNSGALSETKYLLESIKCRNFFGLDFDISSIHKIKIHEEDFELFLDVIDLIGYDDKTINLIKKNIPEAYDLTKFSKELLQELLNATTNYRLASSSHDTTIKIWESNTPIHTLSGHTDNIWSICYSPDNEYIISGSADRSIKIWNANTGLFVRTLLGHTGRIFSVCYSPDGMHIASSGEDTYINIWDAITGDLINTLFGHKKFIYNICYSPDNKLLASASGDHTVKIWDAQTGNIINTLSAHTNGVYCVCFSPDNKHLISGSYDTCINIWNTETGSIIKVLSDHTKTVLSVCYSHDNKYIISTSDDTSIKLWNATTYELLRTFKYSDKCISCACFSPDDKYIAVTNAESHIMVLEPIFGMNGNINFLRDHTNVVTSLCYSSFLYNDLTNRIIEALKN